MRAGGTRGKSGVHPDLAFLLRSLSPSRGSFEPPPTPLRPTVRTELFSPLSAGSLLFFFGANQPIPQSVRSFTLRSGIFIVPPCFASKRLARPPARTRPDGLVEERRCCVQRLVPCCLLRHHHLTITKVALNSSASQGFRLPSDMLTTFSREERGRMVM